MKQGCCGFYFVTTQQEFFLADCYATDSQTLLTALTVCVIRRHWRQWVLSHNASLKAHTLQTLSQSGTMKSIINQKGTHRPLGQ